MNLNPLVTIITVVYNGETYLQQTIESVSNQTYKNIEYVIIDGGSTDSTLDIIKQNESKIAFWVSEPDSGLYDAMNKGIMMANGELIGMINSDDWYEDNAVELMVNAFNENPHCHIFHADRYNIDEQGKKSLRKFNPSVTKFLYYGMTYNHPSMFISREEYKKHMYNVNLTSLADYQFVLEAFLRDRSVFCYIEQPLVNYRLEGISTQISLRKALKEGFQSRKSAGLNNFTNFISVLVRFVRVKLKR